MTELEDDIARIAALRGRPAAEYQAEAAKPRLSWMAVDAITTIPEGFDAAHDMEWFDHLPPAVRAYIREQDVALRAAAIYAVWFEVRDESLVIQTIATSIRRKAA